MKKIIFGMVVSVLLIATGFLNMLLIIQKGGAGPAESQLSGLAPVVSGFFLFLFFEYKRKKINSNKEHYNRMGRLL